MVGISPRIGGHTSHRRMPRGPRTHENRILDGPRRAPASRERFRMFYLCFDCSLVVSCSLISVACRRDDVTEFFYQRPIIPRFVRTINLLTGPLYTFFNSYQVASLIARSCDKKSFLFLVFFFDIRDQMCFLVSDKCYSFAMKEWSFLDIEYGMWEVFLHNVILFESSGRKEASLILKMERNLRNIDFDNIILILLKNSARNIFNIGNGKESKQC